MSIKNDAEYLEWLEKADVEDSEETKGWFECPENERHQYIEDHMDWWKKF